jgi:hypothetical protein
MYLLLTLMVQTKVLYLHQGYQDRVLPQQFLQRYSNLSQFRKFYPKNEDL